MYRCASAWHPLLLGSLQADGGHASVQLLTACKPKLHSVRPRHLASAPSSLCCSVLASTDCVCVTCYLLQSAVQHVAACHQLALERMTADCFDCTPPPVLPTR